ncbi:MAG: type III secretion system chaperone [Planctomycetota bacterium]|nr:type III secretion system chaperone [Planctomycetota bacterium]MDA1214895.1 type III secretion system chaperone [Planctomycetota bacterium]
MQISFRGLLVVGTFSLLLAAMAYAGHVLSAADGKSAKEGTTSTVEIGRLLSAMGVQPKLEDQRFDFTFKATQNKSEEWDLSMSVALSNNKESLWVMAWLDELPRSASEVPRSALLQLLSDNDHLGNGKFFAYVSANRRFVLQTVIPAKDLNSEKLRAVLKDLGSTVVLTYPHWNVDAWRQEAAEIAAADREEADEEAEEEAEDVISEFAKSVSDSPSPRTRSAINDPKIGGTIRK